nr:MAG TPA: hypothetical protein [Caudoviricetes sp.]
MLIPDLMMETLGQAVSLYRLKLWVLHQDLS